MFNIKKIVDLSLELNLTTPVFPGNPLPKIDKVMDVTTHGINLHELSIGSQCGSHCDAPYHFREDGQTVDQSPLNDFIGEAVVISVINKEEQEEITLNDLQPYMDQLEKGKVVLFRTDWSQYIGQEKFYKHPYASMEVINFCLEKGIRTFGVDCINLDKTGGTTYPVHEKLAEVGGMIIENLTNFSAIDFDKPIFCAFPLKISGADGSPVRAIAMQL